MTKNDKIVAAFLVSLGLFSSAQAMQYVCTLSNAQKSDLVDVKKMSKDVILASASRGLADTTWQQDPKS